MFFVAQARWAAFLRFFSKVFPWILHFVDSISAQIKISYTYLKKTIFYTGRINFLYFPKKFLSGKTNFLNEYNLL